jgi:hypothetical protein
MYYNDLSIIKDCYWSMNLGNVSNSGSNTYNVVSNHNDIQPVADSGIYTALQQGGTSEYIKHVFRPTDSYDKSDPYVFRVERSNIHPTHIFASASGTISGSDSALNLYINGELIDSIGTFTSSNDYFSIEHELTEAQKERIIEGKIGNTYDWCALSWQPTSVPSPTTIHTGKIYGVEIGVSGIRTWDNYETGLNTIDTVHYPSGIKSNNVQADSTDHLKVAIDPTDGGADTEYISVFSPIIQLDKWSGYNTPFRNRIVSPSGNLALHFNVNDFDNHATITRASLAVRINSPYDTNNLRDTFDVRGYNKYANGIDNAEEMGINTGLDRTNGYILYGKGAVLSSGFNTYDVELNFVDPAILDASTKHRSADIFRDIDLELWGLPSGTQVSAAELSLERVPSAAQNLFIAGGVYSHTDTLTVESGVRGDGEWQFRNSFSDSDFFDTCWFDFAYDDDTPYMDRVDSINSSVWGTPSNGNYLNQENYVEEKKYAEAYNFYRRKPPRAAQQNYDPKGYSNALFIGDHRDYYGQHINLHDSVDLGNNFTLYLQAWGDGKNTDGVWFYRGSPKGHYESYTDSTGKWKSGNGEILINADDDHIFFHMFDIYDNKHTLSHFLGLSPDPISIIFSYKSVTDNAGYFSVWVYNPRNDTDDGFVYVGRSDIFVPRKFNDAETVLLGLTNAGGSYTTYSPLYLDRSMNGFVCEFGIAASGYDNGDSGIQEFFNSRLYNANALNDNSDYLSWNIPKGSGSAQYGYHCKLTDITDFDPVPYELQGPIKASYDKYKVVPSAIKFNLDVDHVTDHPSGVKIQTRLNLDKDGSIWKSWQGHTFVPSGESQSITIGHEYDYGFDDIITWEDVERIWVELETEYVDLGNTQYFGQLNINELNVESNNWVQPYSENANITVYTVGTASTISNETTLFIKNWGVQDLITLFTHGISSDNNNITLFAGGDFVHNSIPLFLKTQHGLTDYMSLYIPGPSSADCISSMPLYIESRQFSKDGITLFITSPSGTNNNIPLYIQGLGTADGYLPYNNNVPLVIQGPDSGIDNNTIPLFIKSEAANNNIDLFIKSSVTSNLMDLFITGLGAPSGVLELYTHGF